MAMQRSTFERTAPTVALTLPIPILTSRMVAEPTLSVIHLPSVWLPRAEGRARLVEEHRAKNCHFRPRGGSPRARHLPLLYAGLRRVYVAARQRRQRRRLREHGLAG